MSSCLNELNKQLANNVFWPYAQHAWQRVLAEQPEEVISFFKTHLQEAKWLLRLCASSSYLTNLLVRRPDWLGQLFVGKAFKLKLTKEDFLRDLRPFIGQSDFASQLRQYKNWQLLRIWAKDVNQLEPLETVLKEWSTLADACLQVVLEQAATELAIDSCPFFIIGLGKLGAQELNYCSDIDIAFFYERNEGMKDIHQRMLKLAKRITALLGHPDYGEPVFKVDLNLRPGGKESELVLSTRGAEIYYEQFGSVLERLALVRARCVAGNMAACQQFLNDLRPFVYRRYFDFSAALEIQALKQAIDLKNRLQKRLNIKLSQGGIRELEFFVNALQLVYGGRYAELQTVSTFKAIRALKGKGIISNDEAKMLERAYRFLRRLEHLCQMRAYTQTYFLPQDAQDLECLTHLMGFKTIKSFWRHFDKIRAYIHRCFKALLGDKGETESKDEVFKVLFQHELLEDEAITLLKEIGFKDPKQAYQEILRLKGAVQNPRVSRRSREIFGELLPRLLEDIKDTVDKDLALSRLGRFLDRIGPWAGFYALLKENAALRRLLLQLFGGSEFLSNLLITYYGLFDQLITASGQKPVKSKQEIEDSLKEHLKGQFDFEETIARFREFKNEEILRIGFADLGGRLSVLRVSQQLSLVAEVVVASAYDLIKDVLAQKGLVSEFPFIIIALGKLGSQEMAYHSDLDLIFIYDYPSDTPLELSQEAHTYFIKLSQRLISFLTMPHPKGPGYQIDTRLRPSGRFGPLVVSFKAFKDYYLNQAQPWEYQVLLKARCLCGEQGFAKRWEDFRQELLFGKPVKKIDWREEISKMRERIFKERAKETPEKFNIKLGKGGLIELDFLAQYFGLTYGHQVASLRKRHPLQVFQELPSLGLCSNDELKVLTDGYYLLKSLEHRLNLVYNRSSEIPIGPDELRRLWEHWGLKAPPLKLSSSEFIDYFKALRLKVHQIWQRYFK